jgi:hypothetical protein
MKTHFIFGLALILVTVGLCYFFREEKDFKTSIGEKFEKTMMAVGFAEAGEHDTALEIMGEQKRLRHRLGKACGSATQGQIRTT